MRQTYDSDLHPSCTSLAIHDITAPAGTHNSGGSDYRNTRLTELHVLLVAWPDRRDIVNRNNNSSRSGIQPVLLAWSTARWILLLMQQVIHCSNCSV